MTTKLTLANNLLRQGACTDAIKLYVEALNSNEMLKGTVTVNIAIALCRLGLNFDSASVLAEIEKYTNNDFQLVDPAEIDKQYFDGFDSEFYLLYYPEVKSAGIDPFQHYSNWGWRERRKPNAWFDPNFYMESYEKHVGIDEDPFKEYIRLGKYSGRLPKNAQSEILNALMLSNSNSLIERIDISGDEGYVPHETFSEVNSFLKVIAFYLPQFHPFPENDKWWGKGFTEWSNVAKAKPNYNGHYQPHLPIHNGFYDLRIPDVMREQVELAKNYGVHGFNFYYYWFDGKVLMHKPFEILLENKDIDIKYCLTWANENWTRRWDGAENDILIAQNHCEDDSLKFIQHMLIYFNDSRYIKINGRPVLIVYRSNIIPDMDSTIRLWRNVVKDAGFDDIYLIAAQTFGLKDPRPYGFDAAMEFPPHTVKSSRVNERYCISNDNYTGNIYDYKEVVMNACVEIEPEYKKFRTAMLSWDNTARKQDASHIFANFSVSKYKQWLTHISHSTINNNKYNEDEKIVFINAWNEWAEGTHLEPDREKGYSYLKATRDVVRLHDREFSSLIQSSERSDFCQYAVILHLHYADLWTEISEYLRSFASIDFDLYISIDSINAELVANIKSCYPSAHISLVENRGRDVRPFVNFFKLIKDRGYKAVCKIHSKKSVYRADGDVIRGELIGSLLGGVDTVQKIISFFNSPTDSIGLVTSEKYVIEHNDKNMTYDGSIVSTLCDFLGFSFNRSRFPAGSMYWFSVPALSGLERIDDNLFLTEDGLTDGALPHAVERIIISLVERNNFAVKLI